jgi:hypothetical protein
MRFVALAFHAMMGLAASYDFSAAAAGFLVLFLPDDTPARLTDLGRRRPWLGRAAGLVARFARTPVSLPIVVAAAYAVFGRIRLIESPFAFSMRVWIVFTVAAFVVLMFSNLMTEGDRWNHFLPPRAMKVFPLQDNLVQVVRSFDRRFCEFANRRTIAYERGGQRYEVARVGDDPVLSRRPGWIVGKLMDVRTVARRNVCRH